MEIVYSEPCSNIGEAIRQVRARDVPRLTIGIPTHDRPEMLMRAIDSALAQTVPCRIVIADDGDTTRTLVLLGTKAYVEHYLSGRIVHLETGAKSLWANWDACARACDTEFFLWLQDDDVIMETVAERVAAAFDEFPEADTWIAQNKLAYDETYFWWNNGNGPWLPLHRRGRADRWESEIFAPTSYFLSWSLSPAVAFRCGANFTDSLDAMPTDCAIFAERLILAGMRGKFVADPMVAGLWIQHRDNEHRRLHDDQPRQSRILIDRLDRLMDATPDWPDVLALWCRLQHPQWVAGWMGDLEHVQREGGRSRHGEAIRDVMLRSLEGRVKFVPRYRWWRRAFNRLAGRAAL